LTVADSSVLIHLAAIGRLDLLRSLFERLTLPPAVWREVVEEGSGRPGAREIEAGRRDGWIEVRQPSNELLLRSLKRQLDHGEAEAICLAVEHGAGLILLDESEARRVAAEFELERTGAIGVLMRSKLERRITLLRPELDRLRTSGFWIESALYQRALAAVGEAAVFEP
jgi:predicted nucleic acid-binding protein